MFTRCLSTRISFAMYVIACRLAVRMVQHVSISASSAATTPSMPPLFSRQNPIQTSDFKLNSISLMHHETYDNICGRISQSLLFFRSLSSTVR